MAEVHDLFRKATISLTPKKNLYEQFGLTQNPFPYKQSIIVGSSDPRLNGSIYLPDIRQEEQRRFEELMIPDLSRPHVRTISFLMDYATKRGRGIGKTAFLNYQRQQIMKDLGNALSGGSQVIFAIHILPEAGRQRKFWQLAKLIAETFNEQDIIAHSIWRMRVFSGVIPDDVLQEIGQEPQNTIGNDQWLAERKINVTFDLNRCVQRKLETAGIRADIAELLAHFGHSSNLFGRNFLSHQTDYRWRNDGGAIVFDNFVRLFLAAGFTRGILLIDEVEKIVTPQNTLERRTFVDSLRYFFIDGNCENARQSFYGLLLTIHPHLQELLLPHWEAAGLDRFCAIGRELASEYTVYFKPLTQESAVPLVICYLDRFRTNNELKGKLVPFENAAIEEALVRSGGVPGPMLRLLFFSIEKAIHSQWTSIGAEEIKKVMQEQPPEIPGEIDRDEALPDAKIDLIGTGDKS